MVRWSVTLTYLSVDKILACYHSNDTSLAEVLHISDYSFLRILQNEIWKFCWIFCFGHFRSERAKLSLVSMRTFTWYSFWCSNFLERHYTNAVINTAKVLSHDFSTVLTKRQQNPSQRIVPFWRSCTVIEKVWLASILPITRPNWPAPPVCFLWR